MASLISVRRQCLGSPIFYPQCLGRRAFSGAPKPTWAYPVKEMYHPQIPDRYHYLEHDTLNKWLLMLRYSRPYFDKIAKDIYNTVYKSALGVQGLKRFGAFVRSHNPDFRLQLVAFVSFFVTQYCITMYFSDYMQKLLDVKEALHLHHAKQLQDNGFFTTDEEAHEAKIAKYNADRTRLLNLWDEALRNATEDRSFETLCSYLPVKEEGVEPYVQENNKFRFDQIPYGNGNEDTRTFPIPDREQPLRAFSLNFTYNNLSGDWGDFINRRDNKSALLRHARPMFTDIYIPPTK